MLRRTTTLYVRENSRALLFEDEKRKELLDATTDLDSSREGPGRSPGYLPCLFIYLRCLVCLCVRFCFTIALLVEKRVRQVKQSGKLEDVREREISFSQPAVAGIWQ